MTDMAVRKRFFINGEAQSAQPVHDRYLKAAYLLLADVKASGVPQKERQVDHNPLEVKTELIGDTTRTSWVDGATLRAISRAAGVDEIWIDVRWHHVDTTPGGKEKRGQYFWVGARIHEGEDVDDEHLILLVYEPDGANGEPGAFLSTYHSHDAHPPLTGHTWIGESSRSMPGTGHSQAQSAVMVTEHGMWMTSADWGRDLHTWDVPNSHGNVDCFDAPWIPDPKQTRPREQRFRYGLEYPLWTHTCTVDPDPGEWPTDTGERNGVDLLRLVEMFKFFNIAPMVLGGKYIIKVGIATAVCEPTVVEIEVHVGKAPWTIKKRWRVTIETGSDYFRLHKPYGQPPPDPGLLYCPFEVGANPHWRNWWSGAIEVDVAGSAIVEPVKPYLLPSHGFTPDVWPRGLECEVNSPGQVTFVGLLFPTSGAYISPSIPLNEVIAVASITYANMTVNQGAPYSIFGDPNEYPIAANRDSWAPPVETGLPLHPDLVERAEILGSVGVSDGVLYMIVTNYGVGPAIVVTATAIDMTDLVLNVGDYYGTLYAMGVAGIAAVNPELTSANPEVSLRVPGAFSVLGVIPDEGLPCPTPNDIGQVPSAAVEVPVT